jgi:hypothetical protein
MATLLGAFCNQLVRFFEELTETFPEERDIKMALEAIQGARKVNPRLILDVFYESVAKEGYNILNEGDEDAMVQFAKKKIINEYNEIKPALMIFEKYWPTMSDANKDAIMKYLKVLCVLCMKAKTSV